FMYLVFSFFFQAEDGIRDRNVTGVQTCALPIYHLEKEHDEDTAAVIVQYPNFLGQIEPLEQINEIVEKQSKSMFVVSSNPLALGYLTPPGEFGADIVVGDTQVFGIPAQFGGPHCGYFATTKKLMRKVPGRVAG